MAYVGLLTALPNIGIDVLKGDVVAQPGRHKARTASRTEPRGEPHRWEMAGARLSGRRQRPLCSLFREYHGLARSRGPLPVTSGDVTVGQLYGAVGQLP